MTAAKRRQQQSGPDPSSAPRAVEPPPGFRADDHSWVLQTVMELQRSVGELDGNQKALTTAIEQQSGKIDAQRSELTASIEKQSGRIDAQRSELTASIEKQSGRIDAQRSELTASIEKQSELVRTANRELSKLTGAISFAKWAVGSCIAVSAVLIALAGLVLYRLPAIIEAVLSGIRDSGN